MSGEASGEASMDRTLELMRDARTIAVVGVASDPSRPSHEVAAYLIAAGYTVYLVNPTEREIFGRPAAAAGRSQPARWYTGSAPSVPGLRRAIE